jgi:hypothetical protein
MAASSLASSARQLLVGRDGPKGATSGRRGGISSTGTFMSLECARKHRTGLCGLVGKSVRTSTFTTLSAKLVAIRK